MLDGGQIAMLSMCEMSIIHLDDIQEKMFSIQSWDPQPVSQNETVQEETASSGGGGVEH